MKGTYIPNEPNPRLLRNKARCLKCKTIIESRYRHDFVTCPCGSLSVDGGLAYIRRVGNVDNCEELSEYGK